VVLIEGTPYLLKSHAQAASTTEAVPRPAGLEVLMLDAGFLMLVERNNIASIQQRASSIAASAA
jgi:hypothetical protein